MITQAGKPLHRMNFKNNIMKRKTAPPASSRSAVGGAGEEGEKWKPEVHLGIFAPPTSSHTATGANLYSKHYTVLYSLYLWLGMRWPVMTGHGHDTRDRSWPDMTGHDRSCVLIEKLYNFFEKTRQIWAKLVLHLAIFNCVELIYHFAHKNKHLKPVFFF